MIEFVKSEFLDKDKYGKVINAYNNGRIYPMVDYISTVSQCWGALIVDDYEVVMPISYDPWYGFKKQNIPLFVQQLGVYGISQADQKTFDHVIKHARSRLMNFACPIQHEQLSLCKGYRHDVRVNYELDLYRSYDEISNRYEAHLKRNLKKANSHDLEFYDDVDRDIVIQFIEEYSKDRDPSPKRLKTIYGLMDIESSQLNCVLYGVKSDDEYVAIAVVLHNYNRITLLIPRSSSKGRALNAMAFLIDQIIQRAVGTQSVLDFEGSMLSGVARFYQQFGAVNRPYAILK